MYPQERGGSSWIDEGSRLLIEVRGGYMTIKPLPDAIYLSLYGEKLSRITLEGPEEAGVEEQEKPKVLVDTPLLLPALGVDVENEVLDSIALFRRAGAFYLEIALAEAPLNLNP